MTDHPPISLKWAYAILGWLLGTFPSAIAVIVFLPKDSLSKLTKNSSDNYSTVLIVVSIALACSIVGILAGYLIGLVLTNIKHRLWLPVALSPLCGIMWSVMTGGLGGALGVDSAILMAAVVARPKMSGSILKDIFGGILLLLFIGLIAAVFGALVALPYGIIGFGLFSLLVALVSSRTTLRLIHVSAFAVGITLILVIGTLMLKLILSQ